MDFYATSAQVIPVILLGLAFELRYFRTLKMYDGPNDPENPDFKEAYINAAGSIVALWVLGVLAAGEIAAFVQLESNATSSVATGLIWTAMVVGGIALVAPMAAVHTLWLWKLFRNSPNYLFFYLLVGSCCAILTWRSISLFAS